MTALLRVLAILGVPAELTDDGVFLYTLRMDVLPQNSLELPVHNMLQLLASAVTAVLASEEPQKHSWAYSSPAYVAPEPWQKLTHDSTVIPVLLAYEAPESKRPLVASL